MRTSLIISTLFLFLRQFGQTNLVTNPSFEIHSNCPSTQGQASLATGWFSAGDTPDYLNSCATSTNFGVPINWGGYQNASTGNAYCGLGTYLSKKYLAPNVREFVGSQLTATLNIGIKYFVSFKANVTNSSNVQCNCATKKLGTLFTKNAFNLTGPISMNYTTQVFHNNFITDTLNWTKVFGSFVADSNYRFICIGNFNLDNNTDTLILDGGSTCSAYYFIDDVCVSTDSLFALNYIPAGISENTPAKKFSCFPNPTNDILTLTIPYSKNISTVEIIDLSTRTVFIRRFNERGQLSVSDIPDGLYIIKIHLDTGPAFDKIIIQH